MVIDDIPKPTKVEKVVNALKTTSTYKNYSDRQREDFIDMIESAQQRGMATKIAKEMGIEPRVAQRWWKNFREKDEMPYKKSIAVKALLPMSTTVI
jgi:transposase-like protein